MISFVIPSYNRQDYLVQLLDSIISQEYEETEILIIDDNSKDDTEAIVQKYSEKHESIKYFKNEINMGCGFSRGFGFNKSIGKYVIFADDDDYYTDNLFLSKSISLFEKYPELAFVSGNSYVKDEGSGELNKISRNVAGYIKREVYLENFGLKLDKPHSTFPTVFRRDVLEKAQVGTMHMVNDVSIYLRALLFGDAFLMDDLIGVYRIHGTNISKSLSSDFIVENLDEKLHVFKMGLENGTITDRLWLKKNYDVTLEYYFRGSDATFGDLKRLLKWGRSSIDVDKAVLSLGVISDYFLGKVAKFKRKAKSIILEK